MNRQIISVGFLVIMLGIGMADRLHAATSGKFTYNDNGTYITITDYPTSEEGEVEIPSTIIGKPVTSIGYNAFSGCSGLTSVIIPTSVTNIMDGAFLSCSGLTNVTIPSSVTSIGSFAFSGCSGLTSVTVPSSVTNISDGAFGFCTGLTSVTISSGVTSIGGKAFYGCNGLTSVHIPSSVTSIGVAPFADCAGLITLSVDAENPNYASNDGVLFNKSQTTLIQCPGGKLGNYVIPSSVTKIDVASFLRCSGLTNVTIPSSVTSIGHQAFILCSGLTSVIIPSSVTSIGEVFYGCSGLITVIIPSSVTSIGDSAFKNCSSLTGIYFQGNPPTLGGADVFYGDVSLIIYYLPGTSAWPFIYGSRATVLITNPLKIFQISQSLLPDGSQDLLTPAGDGIPNLHKYAFNMIGNGAGQAPVVATPNTQRVTPSGSAGLPQSEYQDNDDTRLKWTYIRRKASTSPGITYLVEFTDNLDAPSWAVNSSATESVTSIDADFERVVLTDSVANAAKRFSRVRVTSP